MPLVPPSARLHLQRLDDAALDAVHALFSSDWHTIGDGPVEVALPHRGRGYAAEAAGAVTEAAHSAGHVRLWATIRPTNIASARTVLVNGYRAVRSEVDAKGPLDYYTHPV